jgi:glucose/arabinose dehydrogenase
MMATFRNIALAASLFLSFANCGGGGGGNHTDAPALVTLPASPPITPPATPPTPSIQLQAVATGFSSPLFFASIPGANGRSVIVEQRGTVQLLSPTFTTQGTLLDISAQTLNSGEQGLLGLAFDPNFASNGYFYVDYVSSKSGGRCAQAVDTQCTRISRFTLNRDGNNNLLYSTVSNASEKVLLEISQPFANHKGGMLAFGPDNYLYIGMGDGGSGGDPRGNAQNLGTLLGKILRIDPSRGSAYAIPADNPFANSAGAKPEIWAYGLRNPWRFSFDRQTGRLWAADVGQDAWEEIDLIVSGGNYGWNAREGAHVYNGAVTAGNAIDPVWEYDHTHGQSISGGYVYRGAAIPALQGYYVYGDFVSGNLWALNTTTLTNLLLSASGRSIASFGEDASGELYLLDYGSGSLLRIAP